MTQDPANPPAGFPFVGATWFRRAASQPDLRAGDAVGPVNKRHSLNRQHPELPQAQPEHPASPRGL